MQKTYWKRGEWNVICDRCGWKKKISQTTLAQDLESKNLLVCNRKGCLDEPQPQTYVRGVTDKQTVPLARPEAPDQFV
jgi:hypothetical protein